MRPKDKTIWVTATIVVAPTTKKAFLAAFHDSDGEELGQTWLPYSQVTQVVRDCGGFTVEGEGRGVEVTLEVPLWLTETERMEPLIREQLLEKEADADSMREAEEEAFNYDDDIPF